MLSLEHKLWEQINVENDTVQSKRETRKQDRNIETSGELPEKG